MERAALCARTGATGQRRGELSRLPAGLGIPTRALEPRLRRAWASPSLSPGRNSPKKGREGSRRVGRWGRGRFIASFSISPSTSVSSGNLCRARVRPLILSQLRVIISPLPLALLLAPSLAPLPSYRVSPPLPLASLSSGGSSRSRSSTAGDGQSARAAQQLRTQRSPCPRLAAPRPPLLLPRRPSTSVSLLG
nr:uncharacterized protein LOC103349852 [Oryctolagus cuniculus]